jgi:hypothetical protein
MRPQIPRLRSVLASPEIIEALYTDSGKAQLFSYWQVAPFSPTPLLALCCRL